MSKETAEQGAARLSTDRKKLLELITEQQSRRTEGIPQCSREFAGGTVRLIASWAQQRLWFIDLLEGGSPGYYVPFAVRLRGAVDSNALERALDALVRRHEVLRTRFVSVDGEVWQEILEESHFVLQRLDLSQYEESERERRVRLNEMEEARGSFDLATGPLIRGKLLRLGAAEHILLVTMHHIVSDRWSVGVMINELAGLYETCRGGDGSLPTALPVQYADYAQWQRQLKYSESSEKQLVYWRACLEGAAPQLELPTDYPRPPVQSYRGQNVGISLDPELVARLKGVARQRHMTLFMVLLTGWAILLARLSGQEDVVIGTPVANRQRPELEGLIGLFVNTLALRLRVRGDLSLNDLLERAREVTLTAFDHQNVPFERVVEALRPERSLSRNPIFQVMFGLQNLPMGGLHLPGVVAIPEETADEPALCDLLLSVEERDGRVVGTINFAADLFERATVERWAICLTELLKAMVKGGKCRVDKLPILGEAERSTVVELFNTPRLACRNEKLIHQLFEEQAHRTPDAVAVVYENQSLTYEQLNVSANKLARYLRMQGVGPDQRVAICLERSLEMVIALVGTLKAGGAYVPLDPGYPAERLDYILEDSTPRVLLTQQGLMGPLSPKRAKAILFDKEWCEIEKLDGGNLSSAPGGPMCRNLAYVIYTSGSTGRPKGVMVEHRNVARLFAATEAWFKFNARDVWSLFHSFAFDFSVWELWGGLAYGGRVVVVPYHTARSPEAFYSLLCRENVTVLSQTPSAFSQLIDARAQAPEMQHSLRVVIFGGEALDVGILKPWIARYGAASPGLVNMYGITETTVHVTYLPINEREVAPGRTSQIGHRIPDLRLYILSPSLQPVPIGVTGEIYVAGAGVARGYLNRPDLTAERFIADPFHADTEIRMYKTGDLGRWRSNGAVEYVGRNDEQVKIRGFRIELGEIEAQLASYPGVREAVVLAREDIPGERRLVAYVTSGGERELLPEDLRTHTKARVPLYMVPSAFVILKSLPLTSNGKLDRRALPTPDFGAFSSRQYEAPKGHLEELLAGVWQMLLRVDRVSRRDNFFELGGHSLLIVKMMERLRRMGLSVEVRDVFETPALAELARALRHGRNGQLTVPPNLIPPGCGTITPPLLPLVTLAQEHIEEVVRSVPGGTANVQDIYPLVALQEGILFHHLLSERGGDTYVLPTVLEIASWSRLESLVAALQAVIDRHDILRTAIVWERLPQPVQVVYRQAKLVVEQLVLDPGCEAAEQIREWIKPENQNIDMRRAPLMRLSVAPGPDGERWYALLQMHHITCDHLTYEIVVSEVMAHIEGRQRELPNPVPYRNHVAQALAYAATRDAEAFFKRKLGDVYEPSVPFGLSDVRGDGSQLEESRQLLNPRVSERVRAQARRLGVSAATLFHAAWGLVSAHTSGRDDVVFGSVLLGRLQGSAGAQRVLGMFINTLPLRLRLRDVTARELVDQTHIELTQLLGHEQAPLALAQRCSGVMGGEPLFSALLNYRHSDPKIETDWGDASGIRVLGGQERTNYPILVSVDDMADDFALTAQTYEYVGARRVTAYLQEAIEVLVMALEQNSLTAALALPILPKNERDDVIESFNQTYVAASHGGCVHELFEAQVERTPDAVAVIYGQVELSYAQLNARANGLAKYLRARGIGPDQPVGVHVERSLEMIVALLGVLKAGGAYVPLDPSYPQERLKYMLADAAPKVLLTTKSTSGLLRSAISAADVAELDLKNFAGFDEENLQTVGCRQATASLVYVIYTSGSTGRPKGIAMPHAAMVNLLEWHRRVFPTSESKRVLQFAALSFDVAFQEIFTTLCTGNTLVLLTEVIRRDPLALIEFLRKERIQRLFIPPLMLQSLAECVTTEAVPEGLEDIIVAGDRLNITSEISSLLSALKGCRLHNHYGPTETHVVTTLSLSGNPERWAAAPTIGCPISNTQIYILDRQLNPSPIGVSGEVYIGGLGVARGYLRQPELTADRFIANPFGAEVQSRIYRTGDLGRWRADGALEYLGRNDEQVKIRGYRIEPREIEAQLARHGLIREAIVAVREDVSGQKYLVAYLKATDGGRPTTDDLRSYLKSAIPEYMVPSAFVFLERFPTNPNGKVDRRALPAPQLEACAVEQYESPDGEVEEMLAGTWGVLLGVERVGRQDNFFELGGHSLHAMRLVAKVSERFSVRLSVAAIFQFPNLRELSEVVESLRLRDRNPDTSGGVECEEGMM